MTYSFLLIGAGSIGQRHARNLVQLGETLGGVFNPSPEKARQISQASGAEAFTSIEKAFEKAGNYDAALICSPNHLHMQHVKLCLSHDLDFFLEKPAFMSSAGAGPVLKAAAKRRLKTLVGCNMRFNAGFIEFERIVRSGRLGSIVQLLAHNSSYLPEWRPGTDYLKNYAAKKATGGGILLDGIHEIDYVRALAGRVSGVSCLCGTCGGLGIETEDTADVVLMHAGGARSAVHLDYLSRLPARWVKAIGTEGAAAYDFISGKAVVRTGLVAAQEQDLHEDRNRMYVREMEHFIRVLDGKEKSACPLADGLSDVQIADAAKKSSARSGLMVKV